MTTHWTITYDAADPRRLARFWAGALGYVDEPGYDFADGAALIDPEGRLPAVSFLKVPEGKTAKNRIHLDIRVAAGQPVEQPVREQRIRTKVAELVAAGATTLGEEREPNGELSHIVLRDPEGNEFCVA
ncbi:VOC family protein [Actinoplanes sp. NPDC049599]|uniref:VOC family protein n=1 Tax=Actinoplanes sp. NPDC049599 TaxID=3363903 RepID=UPI00379FCC37